ncbi:MAG: dephospho-CoA kinase, partial [Acidobacteriota bacterium]
DGSIDRRRLAARVFANPEDLAALNGMVHPVVRTQAASLRDAYLSDHPDGIVVTEAAILIETGSYRDFDCLVVAVCPIEQQIERAMKRDGLSREQVLARLSRQLPIAEKVKFADYLVDTSGSRESTDAQVHAVYTALKQRSDAAISLRKTGD